MIESKFPSFPKPARRGGLHLGIHVSWKLSFLDRNLDNRDRAKTTPVRQFSFARSKSSRYDGRHGRVCSNDHLSFFAFLLRCSFSRAPLIASFAWSVSWTLPLGVSWPGSRCASLDQGRQLAFVLVPELYLG